MVCCWTQHKVWAWAVIFRQPGGRRGNKCSYLGVKRDVELGWCQVQDPGGTYAEVDIFKKLYSEGKIKLRIYKGAFSGPGRQPKTSPRRASYRRLRQSSHGSHDQTLC